MLTIANREDLQTLLKTITANVYFQPPPTVIMTYPCIVYKRESETTFFADGVPYMSIKGYLVTVIDKDPDSLIPNQVKILPMSSFQRHFTVDNLNHDVYLIYY